MTKSFAGRGKSCAADACTPWPCVVGGDREKTAEAIGHDDALSGFAAPLGSKAFVCGVAADGSAARYRESAA